MHAGSTGSGRYAAWHVREHSRAVDLTRHHCHACSGCQPALQVRLKLLPLLLEWDVRQGPRPAPSAGVQFRPSGVRKVSSKGLPDVNQGVPGRQQRGWRYVLLVERLQQQQQLGGGDDDDGGADEDAAADLATDLAWIAGTARSRPAKAPAAAAAAAAAGGGGNSSVNPLLLVEDDAGDDEFAHLATQATQATQASSAAAAAASAGGAPGRSGPGSLQFSEHRSVRCSLMDALWPELVDAYRCVEGQGAGDTLPAAACT